MLRREATYNRLNLPARWPKTFPLQDFSTRRAGATVRRSIGWSRASTRRSAAWRTGSSGASVRANTLSATALAHEAYIKLIGLERIEWRDRSHFFAMAARSMRRILVDYALGRKAQKRGGGAVPVALINDEMPALATESRLEDLLAVDEALTRLEAAAPLVVRIVECRIFAGMTIDETAAVLELSPATVKRHWTTARAWLNRDLSTDARRDG